MPDNKSPVVLTLSSAFYKVAAVSGNETYYTETVENTGSLSKLVGGFTKVAKNKDRRDARGRDRGDRRDRDGRRDRRDGGRGKGRAPESQLAEDEFGVSAADRQLARDLAIRFKLLGKGHKSLDEGSLARMLATGSDQERAAVLEMARATEHIDPRKGPGALSDQDRAALEQASGDLSGMHQERQRVYGVQRAGREQSFGGRQDEYTRIKGRISEIEKNRGRNQAAIKGFEEQIKRGEPLRPEQERAYQSAIRVQQSLDKEKQKLDTSLSYAASGGTERGLIGRAARAAGQTVLKNVTLGKYQTDADVARARKAKLLDENKAQSSQAEKTIAKLEAQEKTSVGLSEEQKKQLDAARKTRSQALVQQAKLQEGTTEKKSLSQRLGGVLGRGAVVDDKPVTEYTAGSKRTSEGLPSPVDKSSLSYRFGKTVGGIFRGKPAPGAGAAGPAGAPGAGPSAEGAAGAAPPPPAGGAAGGAASGAATPPPTGGAAGGRVPPVIPPSDIGTRVQSDEDYRANTPWARPDDVNYFPGSTPVTRPQETPQQRAARLAREKAQAAQTAQRVGGRNPVPPMIPKPPTGPAAGASSA